jgi:signal peptidase I
MSNSVAREARREPSDSPASRKPPQRSALESAKSLIGALLIFFFIRLFVVEAYRIPSGSMIPTLLIGDWLFVNKLVYGPHIPFTDIVLPGYANPHHGDVVVFKSPRQIDQPEDPNPTLVKRLVGEPGDTLYMRAGLLYVNGVPRPQGPGFNTTYDPNDPDPESPPDEVSPMFGWQKSAALTVSRFGAAPAQPTHDNWGPIVVPPKHYFMMGDNRYKSKDSRYYGVVPRENIRGEPLFIYYSYDTDAGLDYFRAITEIRWRRLGHWVK